jgi:26S proteasome regulatory subunit T4
MSSDNDARLAELNNYKKVYLEHKTLEVRVKNLRQTLQKSNQKFDKTEYDLKSIQNVGQTIGEVLKQLDDNICMNMFNDI